MFYYSVKQHLPAVSNVYPAVQSAERKSLSFNFPSANSPVKELSLQLKQSGGTLSKAGEYLGLMCPQRSLPRVTLAK